MRTAMKTLTTTLAVLSMATLVLAGTTDATRKDAKEPFKRLTVEEVANKIKDPAVHVYDGNGEESYKTNHVPGAVLLSSKNIKDGVLPEAKDAMLIFYCANEVCQECHHAAEKAVSLGYTNVYIMPQGIAGWVKAGLPIVKGGNPA